MQYAPTKDAKIKMIVIYLKAIIIQPINYKEKIYALLDFIFINFMLNISNAKL